MRYRLGCLSAFDLRELNERYAALPAAARLHPPQAATPIRMASELLLRELLSEYTGEQAERFRFLRTPLGKPYAENAPQFNLSHSGQWLLCAVGDMPLGVDIETPRTVSPSLLRRVCTPSELALIGDDAERFLRVWTAKEAYLKYLGTGIRGDLRKVETVHDGAIAFPRLHCLCESTGEYTFTIVYE